MRKILLMGILLASSLLILAGCGDDSPSEPPPAADESLTLQILAPADEAIVTQPRINVTGKTVADAVVSINGVMAEIDYQGVFGGEVNLEEGPNIIEVVASDFYGNSAAASVTVIYIP